jgi:hypothetical protein
MRKTSPKIRLHRETLQLLVPNPLAAIAGGATILTCGGHSCAGTCPVTCFTCGDQDSCAVC